MSRREPACPLYARNMPDLPRGVCALAAVNRARTVADCRECSAAACQNSAHAARFLCSAPVSDGRPLYSATRWKGIICGDCGTVECLAVGALVGGTFPVRRLPVICIARPYADRRAPWSNRHRHSMSASTLSLVEHARRDQRKCRRFTRGCSPCNRFSNQSEEYPRRDLPTVIIQRRERAQNRRMGCQRDLVADK